MAQVEAILELLKEKKAEVQGLKDKIAKLEAELLLLRGEPDMAVSMEQGVVRAG